MTTTRSSIDQISQARKVARWKAHETAMDLRHVADLIVKDISGDWKDILSAAQDAEELAAKLTRESVTTARAHGASWAEIGDMLGSSRQNVQQRFGG